MRRFFFWSVVTPKAPSIGVAPQNAGRTGTQSSISKTMTI